MCRLWQKSLIPESFSLLKKHSCVTQCSFLSFSVISTLPYAEFGPILLLGGGADLYTLNVFTVNRPNPRLEADQVSDPNRINVNNCSGTCNFFKCYGFVSPNLSHTILWYTLLNSAKM